MAGQRRDEGSASGRQVSHTTAASVGFLRHSFPDIKFLSACFRFFFFRRFEGDGKETGRDAISWPFPVE